MNVLAFCPVCGQSPKKVMCWIAWFVKCETPGCVAYPFPQFLSRADTQPENPFDVVAARWNACAAEFKGEAA